MLYAFINEDKLTLAYYFITLDMTNGFYTYTTLSLFGSSYINSNYIE